MATRNIVPRATGEGSLGTETKKWGNIYADNLHLSNPLPIANGGTGATTAEQARTNLGLGNVATLNTVPIANGGTGASTVAGARNALGLGNTTGALPIANGGTGASTASQACANIGALPTSGGTMTGRILFDNNNNQIACTHNDAEFTIYGGVNFGGRLGLYGFNHPTAAGQAVLTASISSEAHYSFILDPTNREISWDGEEVPSIAYKDIKFNDVNLQNVIRYRNGLQIITGEFNYSSLTNGVLTFNLPFLNNNVTVLASSTWGDGSNVPKITAFPTTSTQTTILVSEPCYFKFLAIGRWK